MSSVAHAVDAPVAERTPTRTTADAPFGVGPDSPYRVYSATEWAKFRADTPLTLTEEEVRRLRSFNDPVEIDEVRRIYLSLSRLLSSHVDASRLLFRERQAFLNIRSRKVPFVIGVAGSVAAGKSTTARVLAELLGRWRDREGRSPEVALVTTDGFLHPNARLREAGLMDRKGFPESFDRRALLAFLSRVKAGEPAEAPVYDHLVYDIVPGRRQVVDRPDILVFEGLNVLQTGDIPPDGRTVPFVSDFFDFSIYIDADEAMIRRWYVARFMKLRDTAFRDARSFFHRYAQLSEDAARAIAEELWANINAVNLRENILPTRPRADLVLHKGEDHAVDWVALRRL